MPRTAYPRDEALTAVVIGYQSQDQLMIADAVMPRTSPLKSLKYTYTYYAPGQFTYVPNTDVGRRTKVNEVEFKGEKRHGEAQEHALSHPIVPADYDGVENPEAIKADAAAALSELILLDRERRVAGIVLNPANYGANAIALSSSTKLDDQDADIVAMILTAIENCRVKPNIAVMGGDEWNSLKRHPSVLAYIVRATGNDNVKAKGIATKQEVADLFSLKEIIVGESVVSDSSDEDAPFKSAWAGGIAFHYRSTAALTGMSAGMANRMTWGFTAHIAKYSNQYTDDSQGTRGVDMIRVVDHCDEVVVANECGILLHDLYTA